MPNCKNCNQNFTITDQDRSFYDRVSPVFDGKKFLIPPPTFCPDCRKQRRLTWRNDRVLYQRRSSLSGKDIISIYSQNKNFPVYDYNEWWGDTWDPLDYGFEFDQSRSFFLQFKELRDRVPRLNLNVDNLSFNSEFSNQITKSKDCYLVFSGSDNEGCMYSYRCIESRDCLDSLFISKAELCYECLDIYSSYQCRFCQKISDCHDCAFLYDCQGCHDCLFSVGLRNQAHYIFNQKYSEGEFLIKKKQFRFGARSELIKYQKEFAEYIKGFPRKYVDFRNTINVTGDNIQNSKNCSLVFDGYNLEDVSYCHFVQDTKDSRDVNFCCCDSSLQYEVSATGVNAYNVKFSVDTWPNVSNLIYCDSCSNGAKDLFGCVGLRRKQYCILNKQYSEETYNKMVVQIIKQMQKTMEWGQFFPIIFSPFAYNESTAQDHYPLTKSEALLRGFIWSEGNVKKYEKAGFVLPDDIKAVPSSIIGEVLVCDMCGKNYKIIKQELAFYQQQGLPAPNNCFDCRHLRRWGMRNPRRLWPRSCDKCNKQLQSTYAPDRPEKVYCEECYQKEIY